MAGYVCNVLPEGHSTTKPPGFDGENFTFWKMRMKTFMKASEYGLWKVIENGNYVPMKTVDGRQVPKEEEEFNDRDEKKVLLNEKAINIITCALSQKEYFRVSSLKTAKEIWEALETAHEGTSGVKENRVNSLKTEFELFRMNDGETIREMEVRFSHLINHLTALGQSYSQRDQVRKILGGLSKEWEPKVTAIEETRGESMASVTALFGSLAEYESKQKFKNEVKEKSKKGIALKAQKKNDDEEDSEDEEFGLLVQKFRKFYNKRKSQSKESKDSIICFECGKAGHIRVECPQLNKKKDKKHQKKKAFVTAIWGDSSSDSSDDEEDICLVAREDDSETEEVTDIELTYDELFDEYESVRTELIRVAKELVGAKKKIKVLEKQLNEKPIEIQECTKCKETKDKSVELTKTLEKFTKGSEMLNIILGNQRCSSDKSGLGYNPNLDNKEGKKKHGQKSYLNFFKHTGHTSKPYAHCSYCNHKGHTTSSCFYRKKGTPSHMRWVPKGSYTPRTVYTNNSGPKKRWVPKSE